MEMKWVVENLQLTWPGNHRTTWYKRLLCNRVCLQPWWNSEVSMTRSAFTNLSLPSNYICRLVVYWNLYFHFPAFASMNLLLVTYIHIWNFWERDIYIWLWSMMILIVWLKWNGLLDIRMSRLSITNLRYVLDRYKGFS